VASRIRTCFITAPASANLDILTDALRRREIRVVVPHEIRPGTEFGVEILNLMSSVDLVIGVLTRERRSEWVLFELGLAWGQGKRVVLFASPNSTHIPSSVRRFLTVRANLSNREAVEFALDQLLAAPEPAGTEIATRNETRPPGPMAEAYLQGRLTQAANASPAVLETLVAEALREAGVDVVSTSESRDFGADLAIWSDALQLSVGNPLLVEIKARISGPKTAAEAAQQLSKYVSGAGGLWGLLLYRDGPEDLRGLPPNVLALSVEALFSRLGHESFDEVVRDLRNSRVHGGRG
jgi:hypothetical protein